MALFTSLRFGQITLLAVIFGMVFARWEELALEAQWRSINTKPYHLMNDWDEADTLTHEQHKRICDDVLLQTLDQEKKSFSDFTYVNASDIVKERVAKMPVEFQAGNADTLELTLVLCRYNETEFYLAQGETDSVFKLVRDPEWGIKFKSGLHRVYYDSYPGERPLRTYTIERVKRY